MGGGGKCDTGTCRPKQDLGRRCTDASDCLSGKCMPEEFGNRICCDTTCVDECHNCNLSGMGCQADPDSSDARGGRSCGTNKQCFFAQGCQPCGFQFDSCCGFTTCNSGLTCSSPGNSASQCN
jgi:hypothetical protein